VLEEIEEVNLGRLLGLAETADLEFKQETYGNNGEQTREMAYDIAAMANDVGGLIIIGIAEEDGRAASLEGVAPDPFKEEEQLRIQKVVAARLFPHHRIDVHPVASTTNENNVFYVISIPPSEWTPHAVAADLPSLRWPRRSGPGRRWLSESEIADAYRNRHRQAEEQLDRVRDIHEAMLTRLDRLDMGWLVVSLVPNRAGP
jgi:predicted HTH transcriptional regulator